LPAYEADLALIHDAVRQAGQLAMEMRGGPVKQWQKSDHTPVSDADLAVNDLLHDQLCPARPDYGWLSEESEDSTERLDARRVFVVDPIDGTRGYLAGRPEFAVSVALLEAGQPVIGCVFNPAEDALFQAVRGRGATRNGAPIQTGDRASLAGCRMLGRRDLLTSRRWQPPLPAMELSYVNSIAYRICLVASGAWDAAIALTSKGDWDLAAAGLIAHEAGARLTAHDGAPFVFNQPVPHHPSVVCANDALHAEILRHTKPLPLPGISG